MDLYSVSYKIQKRIEGKGYLQHGTVKMSVLCFPIADKPVHRNGPKPPIRPHVFYEVKISQIHIVQTMEGGVMGDFYLAKARVL